MAQEYWKSEIVRTEAGGVPVPEDRHEHGDKDAVGYWRLMAAKLKTDWPVFLNYVEDHFEIAFGKAKPRPFKDEAEELSFFEHTFLNLKAVRRIDWVAATERGEWADGKRAIPQSDEEKFDIIPPATDTEGRGTNSVIDEETGEEVDAYWLQIKTKLEALVEKAKPFGQITKIKRGGKELPFLKIDTLELAEKAAAIRDDIKALGTMGEKRRKEEKEPHDRAAQAVQDKYVPTLSAASEVGLAILNGIDDFQAREKARLEQIERDRIAAETRARLEAEAAERAAQQRAEAEKRAAEAEAAGEVPATEPEIVMPTADEIEAQVQQTVAETPIEVAKPVVQGTAFSRAASKSKTKVGKIVDKAAFCAALIAADDDELNTFLQKRADTAARSKFKIAGVEFIDG